MNHFSIDLDGDFSLAASGEFLRGFAPAAGCAAVCAAADGERLTLGFCLDRSFEPVAVSLEQRGVRLHGETTGPAGAVKAQVERILSLDVDARGWAGLGRRDPVVGALQARFAGFRPVCFPSPYEAAVWGILAQRVNMAQAARMKEHLARAHGRVMAIGGAEVLVVPPPALLIDLARAPGIPDLKLGRLRGIADAALAGRLDADRLRALPEADALAELSELRGVGTWTAAHILYRGAGLADALPDVEPRFLRAARAAYGTHGIAPLAAGWRPYRMWVAILLVRSIAGTAAWSDRATGRSPAAAGRRGSPAPRP
jgi:DNA-3-methyladenine glycosylase II